MIRDNQPIHNIGFNLTSRDVHSDASAEVSGKSAHSGFVARALEDHPVLRMTTAMVATGVAATVAGRFVRQGGLKLGYKLSQNARAAQEGTFLNRSVQRNAEDQKNIRRTRRR